MLREYSELITCFSSTKLFIFEPTTSWI